MALKPVGIKLNNKTASSMYLLIEPSELKYTKTNETKPPVGRSYKIEIAVEAMFDGKRCRGKKTFLIAKNTSMTKAVESLLGKKHEMIQTLKDKGTLKVEKVIVPRVSSKDKKFSTLFQAWITAKAINKSKNTIRTYKASYDTHLKPLYNKDIHSINETDIQNIVNNMINKNKSPSTIKAIKKVIEPLLRLNDNFINWTKIELPSPIPTKKFNGTDSDIKLIVKTLIEYTHVSAHGVFMFSLTGRRIGEIIQLTYNDIDYENKIFTLRSDTTKTAEEYTFALTPMLINAIKSQGKNNTGLIFKMTYASYYSHFKKAMASIGIYDMSIHKLRSMTAVGTIRSGTSVFEASKMLGHAQLSTTQKSYAGGGIEQATSAQDKFLSKYAEDIEDVDIIDEKVTTLKKLYPTATDAQINHAITILES